MSPKSCNAPAEGHKDWNSKQRQQCPAHGDAGAATPVAGLNRPPSLALAGVPAFAVFEQGALETIGVDDGWMGRVCRTYAPGVHVVTEAIYDVDESDGDTADINLQHSLLLCRDPNDVDGTLLHRETGSAYIESAASYDDAIARCEALASDGAGINELADAWSDDLYDEALEALH